MTPRRRWSRLSPALCAVLLAGCKPEFADTDALISAPRILAVNATPAEAAPLTPTQFHALYATPSGPGDPADLSWAFCVARKPLTDMGTLAPECLAASGPSLVPLSGGSAPKGAVPAEACQLFGPDLPLPMPGQPTGRPVDPDASGGYFQPVRLEPTSGPAVVGSVRLACGLSSATADQSIEFTQRYRSNENPAVDALELVAGGHRTEIPPDTGGDPGATVAPGARVQLEVRWADCPTSAKCGDGICDVDEDAMKCAKDCSVPRGCSGAERYLVFEPDARALVTRRESIRVSWFANGGTFESDRTDRGADDDTNHGENVWTAPSTTGTAYLWVVLRDDRGGSGWQSYRVAVAH